jgi:penicillin amidase
LYRTGNRSTTFVPSFRLVTDMATDECHTNLQGGPSDRRFSRWYCSDLENWRSGRYKTLSTDTTQNRMTFP